MTIKIVLLSCLLHFFTFYAQEISSDWETILTSDLVQNKKEEKLDSIINFYQNQRQDSLLERITHKYAIWKYKVGKLEDAIEINQYSLELKKKIYPEDTTLLQNGLKNLAFFYFKNNAYTKSIASYEALLNINSKNKYAADAYAALGRCYSKIGDYHKAAFHFDIARSLLLENKSYKNLVTNNINAAGNDIKLETLSSFNKGIQNLLFTDSLVQKINSRASTRYNIKILLGTLHNQEKNLKFKKALQYYNEALEIAKQSKDTARVAHTLEIIGNLYNTVNPDLAIRYHTKAIDYNTKKDTLQLAISISNIGYCLEQKELYDKCIQNYVQAIELLLSNKSISELSASSPNTQYLLTILKDLANVYLKQFKFAANSASLKQSIETFLMADRLIDLIRIESREFQSKLYWRKQSADLYGKAVEACFLSKNPEQAFYFMEKNKALLLTEDLIKNKLKQSLKLPQELVNNETELRKRIYLLEREKEITTKPKDFDSLSVWILDQKRKLQQLQDSIYNTNYANFEILSSITNLKSFQESLDENTVALEYNISEHNEPRYTIQNKTPKEDNYSSKAYYKGYLMSITKYNIDFIELEDVDQIKKNTSIFIKKAATPFKTKQDITSYQKIGYKVFNQLFPNKKIKTNIRNKKVIIIPDNYLNYLPFEALITSPIPEKKPDYLIESSEISYAYSNSFLENSVDNEAETKDISFLGFAPNNFRKYNLNPLENNRKEIVNIHHTFSGEIFIKSDASKQQFLNQIEDHAIIHLATHANATDSITPWIAFSDDKLRLEELYLTQNNADLVVLSGCNTLLGKQETGEGVMSLARGFFHSGAKSVISSLWSVDDRSTLYIMDQFYKNLKNKQSKSKALRNAKLSYLNNSSLSESSPHYWATFVLLGDSGPILDPSGFSIYWLLLIIPILLICLIAYQKLKKSY